MTQWTVLPVRAVSIESTEVLAEALNDVERAGWCVSDVIALAGGLAIVAYRDDSPSAAGALKLTARQRMKAAGVPRCG